MNPTNAEALARVDAREAIDLARSSGHDPIVWLTGNAYMPPLRGFGHAESAWNADNTGDVWEAYAETFERELDAASVYLGSPDYDNALYVVDLARFEYVDEENQTGDTLQSEWVAHVDYPHTPGYLFDCPACENSCHCTPGNAECVYGGDSGDASDHNGSAAS